MARKRRAAEPFVDSTWRGFDANTAVSRTQVIERMYRRVLTELATNRFTWKGLPPGIDQRFLELQLHRNALAVFFWDDEYDRFMVSQGTPSGRINMYNNPTAFKVTSPVFSKTLAATHRTITSPATGQPVRLGPQAVPIWGNYLRLPDLDVVEVFSNRLAEIDRTIEINLLNLRHPVIIACTETERLSLTQAFRNVQEGQPVIWGTNNLMASLNDSIQLLNTGASSSEVADLQVAKTRIWTEAMVMLGINGANQDKRERLVAAEVDANNEQTMSNRLVALNSRRIACEQINDVFGLALDVEWTLDGEEQPAEPLPGQGGTDGDGDGQFGESEDE